MGTIKIEIQTATSQECEILIAELSEINFDAFEQNENSLSAYINVEKFNEEELKDVFTKNVIYSKTIIEDTNWNAKWESEFEPIIVEDFVVIRAAFHKPIKNVRHEIIITPKMSFGTGHHATTYLMLQQIEHIDFTGRSVLDFGTGTGILAIMAKKLGAKEIVAIDNDVWSINNAKENFIANNCSDISLYKKDTLEEMERFDVILANINLNIITASSAALKDISHSSSKLLLSGFLTNDEQKIINLFQGIGFAHTLTVEKNNWISVLLIKS